jgi:hypothetical protein
MGTVVQFASLQARVNFDEDRAAIEHDYAHTAATESKTVDCAHDRLRFFPEAGFRCADCFADVAEEWD